ncbi:endo-1,4-beta-glucanase, partial [Cryomyces antarcticus]
MGPLRLHIDGRTFRDERNREVTIHGINVAADAKFPARPDQPSHVAEDFFEGDKVSFVGRPFSVGEAHVHFSRLKRWGYNAIRYVFTWEAIEAAGPGKYDEEWIQHTISLLRLAKDYGFRIFMDPHQDVWSRFTGGSGAPMWTVYACGLNPRAFDVTEAALVQNTYPEPQNFPKMIWATNYTRLACQVIFTCFFAGKDFAPKAIIDGKNIQDYLQDHYINACKHLAKRIREAGDLEGDVVIGWESMNEPNRGLIGWPDISRIPSEQKLQKGTSPTAWQAILTGSGRSCEIDTWDFGGMGPYKSGTALVDPKGQSAWLPSDYDDSHYGWKRDPGWKLGECLWAQHGVWDPAGDVL